MDSQTARERQAQESESTLQPRAGARTEAGLGLPALTVAAHPDPDRVGEIAVLVELDARGAADLGRLAPEFAPPGSPWRRRPLADRSVSRRPLALVAGAAAGLEIERRRHPGEVLVDGRLLTGRLAVPAAQMERGVALELAGRVVLVLHRVPLDHGDGSRESHGLIGASAGLERVRAAIERVAGLDMPVLLRGDSGTGKELVAQAIHRFGRRAGGPFVAVNLGALPRELAAAELFGSVRGAYTGAVGGSEGYFRAADGGTLFLDEVGEAQPELQVALLRALETGEVYPVGSQRPRRVDVRLLAATDADLEARVAEGVFRATLLHRLSAYEIRIPPLRERREDVGRLAVHFARETRRQLDPESASGDGAGDLAIPAPLVARLVRHGWPGNVRQLANVVRRLVIDGAGGDAGSCGRLDDLLAAPAPPSAAGTAEAPTPGTASRHRRPRQLTDGEVERALTDCGFEPAEAARRLGVSRPSLYNLIHRHPRLRTAEDVPAAEADRALAEAGGDVIAAARRLRVSARALSRRLRRVARSGGDEPGARD